MGRHEAGLLLEPPEQPRGGHIVDECRAAVVHRAIDLVPEVTDEAARVAEGTGVADRLGQLLGGEAFCLNHANSPNIWFRRNTTPPTHPASRNCTNRLPAPGSM